MTLWPACLRHAATRREPSPESSSQKLNRQTFIQSSGGGAVEEIRIAIVDAFSAWAPAARACAGTGIRGDKIDPLSVTVEVSAFLGCREWRDTAGRLEVREHTPFAALRHAER